MTARLAESKGVPASIEGLPDVTDVDAEILRLNQMILTGIEPRLGVTFHAILRAGAGPIILARVPRGWAGLYMVSRSGAQRFLGRTNAGKYPLDVHQIRAGFLSGIEIGERARRFRDERLMRIRAGEAPVALKHDHGFVLHCIPASAFGNTETINIGDARSAGILAMYPRGSNFRFMIDGLAAVSDESYTILFRNGSLESMSERLVRNPVPSGLLAGAVVRGIREFQRLAVKFGLQPPGFVLGTLFGAKGSTFAVRTELGGTSYYDSLPLDRDVLFVPDAIVFDWQQDPLVTARPMLDALWQAAGLPECDLGDEDLLALERDRR